MQTHLEDQSFDQNWKLRPEARYSHWTRGEVRNQIQLAFRQHWELIQEILAIPVASLKVLEVGCGRGTMSCYFSDHGSQVTLLDNSAAVIEKARGFFEAQKLPAEFLVGDAQAMALPDECQDIVFSMGLLEHFERPQKTIEDQIRVLKSGGLFLAYVIPENPHCVQKQYHWINEILKHYSPQASLPAQKMPVYRSSYDSHFYRKILSELRVGQIESCGVYPLPMISHSIDFPFSLMPEAAELALLQHFQANLVQRRVQLGHHPWKCQEEMGQGFYIWCRKL